MPLFEYECEKCHEKTEELVKDGSVQLKCKKCGGNLVRIYESATYQTTGKSHGCSGNCKTCGGCH